MSLSTRARNNLNGVLFCLPIIVGLAVFTVYPIGASFWYSLSDLHLLKGTTFTGLANYRRLLHDELFWKSLWNTVYFGLGVVVFQTIAAIVLALMLNMRVPGISVFRTIYFLPTLVPLVAMATIWLWMFNPQYGIINSLLRYVGVDGPGWLASPLWSKPSLIMMSVWLVGSPMVIYLAGLQDIPSQLYEAIDIDGGTWFHKIKHVTLPLLSPVILFNVVIGLIQSFQQFAHVYIMTDGGPNNSTLLYALYLYRNAFSYMRMGYASALAWILFAIVFGTTLTIIRFSERRIYYAGQ